ncbi:hypothetical protein K4L44_13270 [Halosquirtibacter laminarini]|uniref:Uncharacterized protein n=1 Tax=Halosquirtibacter laminarini TaxID=3374600 RepID=A0AC61NDA2_9BACT|nr:hypothetical protein K4L44_13270 [Prolixibacteraceae bacterium]
MKKILKIVTLTVLTVTLFACTSCNKDKTVLIDNPELKKEIETIRDPFVKKINSLGLETPNVPIVRIANTPAMITYGSEGLTVPEWKTLEEKQKTKFNNWADQAVGSFSGEQYFKKSFNWFLVIHELGHYVQDLKGTMNNMSDYKKEFQANQIAVAYWKEVDRQALDEYIVWVNAILKVIPAPKDTSESYYNANIEAETSNNDFNGYFQFYFIQQAYLKVENLKLADFL